MYTSVSCVTRRTAGPSTRAEALGRDDTLQGPWRGRALAGNRPLVLRVSSRPERPAFFRPHLLPSHRCVIPTGASALFPTRIFCESGGRGVEGPAVRRGGRISLYLFQPKLLPPLRHLLLGLLVHAGCPRSRGVRDLGLGATPVQTPSTPSSPAPWSFVYVGFLSHGRSRRG